MWQLLSLLLNQCTKILQGNYLCLGHAINVLYIQGTYSLDSNKCVVKCPRSGVLASPADYSVVLLSLVIIEHYTLTLFKSIWSWIYTGLRSLPFRWSRFWRWLSIIPAGWLTIWRGTLRAMCCWWGAISAGRFGIESPATGPCVLCRTTPCHLRIWRVGLASSLFICTVWGTTTFTICWWQTPQADKQTTPILTGKVAVMLKSTIWNTNFSFPLLCSLHKHTYLAEWVKGVEPQSVHYILGDNSMVRATARSKAPWDDSISKVCEADVPYL